MSEDRRSQKLFARRLTRGPGLLVNGFFMLVLVLALVNEDRPAGAGWGVIGGLVICILGACCALRRERIGGRAALGGSPALFVVTRYSGIISGLGIGSMVSALIDPVPFCVVGSLFSEGGWRVRDESHEPHLNRYD